MAANPFRLTAARSGVVILLLAGVAAWWYSTADDDQKVRYRSIALERGDVVVTVSATGSLAALSTVDIGSQVSGQVLEVNADFNDHVVKGQVIARLDPANFQARLTQARADLASARASLEEAQANLRNAEADYARKTELVARQLISRSELDVSLAARDQARARVSSARAGIEQRQAAVANAELDLTYTEIRAPVDGVVLLRQVEPGQTVAASFQTPVLFQIAEDLQQMQIELSVDESDVGQIRAGQSVSFSVDAYPGRQFHGRVRQIRLAAINTLNVITYPVVINVANPDLSLLPGMTATAAIEVAQRTDVWRVPNAALRFKPASVEIEPAQRRLALDLDSVVAAMGLSATQQAAYQADAAAVRERMAARRAAAGNGEGAQGAGQRRPDPERMAQRIVAAYSGFRDTLEPAQRTAFDQAVAEQLNARWATLWLLGEGEPKPLRVQLGISDATHTEVSGADLAAGQMVITGVERQRP